MERRLLTSVTRLSHTFIPPPPPSQSSLFFRTRKELKPWQRYVQSSTHHKIQLKDPVPKREGGSISSYSQPASELNHDVGKEEIEHYDRVVAESKDKQIRTPWHRDGSDEPPVQRQRSAGAMTKGTFGQDTVYMRR